jgi:MYXO-CTERM domain-containing protein
MQRGLLWPRMLNSDYLRREQSIASGVMMFNRTTIVSVFAVSLFTIFSPAKADFVGQTILGPLSAGSSVTGSTLGAPDLNDGFTSGTHIFDIWDGGDRVYGLAWTGGDINISLTSLGGSDNDLFLYTPDNLDDSGIYSAVGEFDSVSLLNATPGFYYIVVDSTFFSEGSYQLDVAPVPAPGALGVFGLVTLIGRRRRR